MSLLVRYLAPFLFTLCLFVNMGYSEDNTYLSQSSFTEEEKRYLEEEEFVSISDPLEPVNRVFFVFNDRFYFWILRPISKVYSFVFPEPLRVGFGNVIENVKMPIRAINSLLQLRPDGFVKEIARFIINTTMGIGGFGDPAKEAFGLKASDEDLGQTFGRYGIGPGFYIVWPFLGPSNLRDTIGKAGDSFLNPISYLDTEEMLAARAFEGVNDASLRGYEYETLKKSALDPYLSLRDSYIQTRQAKIKE